MADCSSATGATASAPRQAAATSRPRSTSRSPGGWRPPVLDAVVAMPADGVAEALAVIHAHPRHLLESGELARRRGRRLEGAARCGVVAAAGACLRSFATEDPSLWDRVASRELDPH